MSKNTRSFDAQIASGLERRREREMGGMLKPVLLIPLALFIFLLFISYFLKTNGAGYKSKFMEIIKGLAHLPQEGRDI